MSLEPGADAPVTLKLNGDWDVYDPQLSVVGASAGWKNLSDWLNRRLTVTVTVANANGANVGNAYNAFVTNISNGTGSYTGLPAFLGTIPVGSARSATFVMNNAQRGLTYNVGVTVTATDGLDNAVPPTNGGATFTAPLLP
jgi:hypothetical protein